MSAVSVSDDESDREFQDLLRRAKAGDHSALGDLFGPTRQYLLKIANDRVPEWLRGATAPSDFVQDALVALDKALIRFEGTEHGWRGYSRIILMNSIRRAIAGNMVIDPLTGDFPDSGHGPGSSVSNREILAGLKKIRSQMKAEYQRVLDLRDQELRWTEIGNQMERTADAARTLWKRAWFDLTDRALEAGLIDRLEDTPVSD